MREYFSEIRANLGSTTAATAPMVNALDNRADLLVSMKWPNRKQTIAMRLP